MLMLDLNGRYNYSILTLIQTHVCTEYLLFRLTRWLFTPDTQVLKRLPLAGMCQSAIVNNVSIDKYARRTTMF